MNFSELGLSTDLLRALSGEGYLEPTPIQQQAIPVVLKGGDLLAGAQTGTGKTAGFALPILQRLMAQEPSKLKRPVRALILTPTRELAAQVGDNIKAYGRHLPLRSTVVFGGVNINPQTRALRQGVDIVVATPGRLLDHASSRTIDLSQIDTLVLDEADRMLDMGFIRDIRRIINLLPKKRQTLLFSATFSDEIRTLAREFLINPAEIQVARRNATADAVSQSVYPIAARRKRELLSEMIGRGNWRQVLVFTRTKHGANRLSEQLCRDGLSAAAIHGNKSQGARTKALAAFKSGTVRVLVATDIAARGLDIDQLPHVVNFELPAVPEDYVHRIGRTGRAGASGHAISLVCREEGKLLHAIERLLGRSLARELAVGYEPVEDIPASNGRPAGRSAKSGNDGRTRVRNDRPVPARAGAPDSGGEGRPRSARPARNGAKPKASGASEPARNNGKRNGSNRNGPQRDGTAHNSGARSGSGRGRVSASAGSGRSQQGNRRRTASGG